MCAARPTLLALSGVRLLLAYHPWTKYLKDDHLLVSPLTSFSRCKFFACPRTSTDSYLVQEGLYLFQHSIDPYTGGLFRQVCSSKAHLLRI
jgi:phosphatidylinositol glycan class U